MNKEDALDIGETILDRDGDGLCFGDTSVVGLWKRELLGIVFLGDMM